MMRRSACTVLLAVVLTAVLPAVSAAQDWSARYPRSPLCDARWTRASAPTLPAPFGALVVRPVLDSSSMVQAYAQIEITPLHPDGIDTTGRRRSVATRQGSRFDSLPTGSYTLQVRFVGGYRELDTIQTRPGYEDTVTLALLDGITAANNEANCRPHRFRRPGEKACLTGFAIAEHWVPYAESFAGPDRTSAFHLHPFQARNARIVTDERICTRAGIAYDSTSPPRRVIVVEVGPQYFVFDPFEPATGGEWQFACFFDRQWRPMTCVAS